MYLRKPLRPNWRSSQRNTKSARKNFPDGISNLGINKTPIGGLLADITHEIRTPMNGMFGMLDFLLSSELTEDQREAATMAQAAAEDLLTLFNNIIDLPMAEVDALSLRHGSFELDSSLKSLLDSISARARIKDTDIEIRYACKDGPLAVSGDIDRLRQVFSNLIMFISRELPREKILVEVASERLEDGRVMLQACIQADSAMPSKKRFSEVADSSSPERRFDAGELGLVICKRLITMMAGKMDISRLNENGFRIQMSLAFDPAPAVLNGVRVLLVDGEAERRASMTKLFASRNVRADAVAEPTEALEALTDARNANDGYRIVLLTRHLRGIDEEELGRAIKMDPAYRDTALILLGPGDSAALRKAGFAATVNNPADTKSLLSAMEKLCLPPSVRASGSLLSDRLAGTGNQKNSGLSGKRILVVDDDAVNRRVALRALEELSCRVDTACDGKEALTMHASDPYDLILMDCEMPVMDGFEATAKIRAAEAGGSRTPVIAWTARFMAGNAGNLLAGGFDDLIPKPMRRQALQEMLSAWISPGVVAEEPAANDEEDEIAEIREMFGDGFAELAALFRSDSLKRIDMLQSASSDKDAAMLAKIAHAFSGSAASIGAARLSSLCKELEMQSRAGKLHDSNERLNAIKKEFARISGKLEAKAGG